MRSVLIQQMMEINRQYLQILDLLGELRRVDRHYAYELEEVEEQGFREPLEDEGSVVVFDGGGCTGSWCGGRGVELGDADCFEG